MICFTHTITQPTIIKNAVIIENNTTNQINVHTVLLLLLLLLLMMMMSLIQMHILSLYDDGVDNVDNCFLFIAILFALPPLSFKGDRSSFNICFQVMRIL